MENFLNMGGYAIWVWPCYALALAALGGILVHTRVTLARREREFDQLKRQRPEG